MLFRSTLISDGSDASVFKDITEILPVNNDFTVTFVGMETKKDGRVKYKVHTMKLDDVTEQGKMELEKVLKKSNAAVMIVTFDAPEGFTAYADYEYAFTYDDDGPEKEDEKHEKHEVPDHSDDAEEDDD